MKKAKRKRRLKRADKRYRKSRSVKQRKEEGI